MISLNLTPKPDRGRLVAQLHDLVELDPEAVEQLQRAVAIETPADPVGLAERAHVLIEAARRDGVAVRLDLDDEVNEPEGLQRLVEGVRRFGRHLPADSRELR
jgi:hypothetical protein